MPLFAKEAQLEPRILSAKFLGFFAAIMLAPGLGGCDAATAQEPEGQLLTPDNAGLAVDAVDEESALAAAFSMPAAADSAAPSSSFCSFEPERVGEAAEALIVCHIRVDHPHRSRHVPGTVNVAATVDCSRDVSGLEMTIGLSCDGQEIVSSSFSNAGSASLEGNAFATGVSGTYQGTAAAKVVYPPGSWPGSGALRAHSPRVPIDFP